MKINALYALAAAGALALPLGATAQPAPTMPSMTAEQSAQLNDEMAIERRTMETRVARGEVTPDEAERFLAWRQWQIAQQLTGAAPSPSAATSNPVESPPVVRRYVYTYPAPYYYAPGPYYSGPYYPGPRYWGPVVCAGGWGHHFGGRVCF